MKRKNSKIDFAASGKYELKGGSAEAEDASKKTPLLLEQIKKDNTSSPNTFSDKDDSNTFSDEDDYNTSSDEDCLWALFDDIYPDTTSGNKVDRNTFSNENNSDTSSD